MSDGQTWQSNARLATSIVAVLLYVSAVLLLKQPQVSEYADERTSIAAAVSRVVLHIPVGSINQSILGWLVQSPVSMHEEAAAWAQTLTRRAAAATPPRGRAG
jgi:hypothetical protein